MNLSEQLGANKVVLALSIARFADALGNSILFIIIPLYVHSLPSPIFNVPNSVLVGVLLAIYGLMAALFQPAMGALTDRFSRRKPFIQVGLLLMAGGTLAFTVASQYSHLLLIRAVQGFAVAITIPASLALMAAATHKQTRGGSMGIYSTMRVLGFAIGPLIGGFLQVHFGFNSAFYVGAGFVFLGVLLVQIWVDEAPADETAEVAHRFKVFDRELLSGGLLALGLATFLMASSFAMMTTLENEFNARLQQTAVGFSIAFSALTFSRVLVQIPLGRLSDRIGRKPLIVAGLLLMAPSTALLGNAGSTLQLTIFRIFQGIASAGVAAPAFALAADLSSAGGEGRQMSIITMGFTFGIAVGPLLAGILAVWFFQLPFYVGAVLSLVGAWIVYRYVPETVSALAENEQ